jgi:branched-chain amino acid aminotransferase
MEPTEKIWRNGSFVPWDEANVHILTHALHYGTGVFEGIRAYDTPRGTAVFRLTDHLHRFRRSAALYEMDLGYSVPELASAIHDYIGAFYNPHRRHSSVGYLSPMDYERQHAAGAAA